MIFSDVLGMESTHVKQFGQDESKRRQDGSKHDGSQASNENPMEFWTNQLAQSPAYCDENQTFQRPILISFQHY